MHASSIEAIETVRGESSLGDLCALACHGVGPYTQVKVVVERCPKQWSRKF
jgi:hypothetical protein